MTIATTAALVAAMPVDAQSSDNFPYNDEKFADIQMLRYEVKGFDRLSLKQKLLIYHLSEAALEGRDILFDQNGKYNLRIRQMLEAVYADAQAPRHAPEWPAFATYVKRVWFSSGIHHHYGSDKFEPGFSAEWLRSALKAVPATKLPLGKGQSVDALCDEVFPAIFDPNYMVMRVNQKDGEDLILTSASHYYGDGVTQAEAEAYYEKQKQQGDALRPVMYGMNTRLVKDKKGQLSEVVWKEKGMYGPAIKRIVSHLKDARQYAESPEQERVIDGLIKFYKSGDLKDFDTYCIDWLKATNDTVDFVNGFTESYGDPLGLKASWESLVNFKDLEATKRAEQLSINAQWFEDNSPVDPRFRKEKTRGISAKVIVGAMLGGDLYPSTAIGINLPNSNWIRSEYGSKSVTIGNFTYAYSQAAAGSGFNEEFVIGDAERESLKRYGHLCDDLHTDLHECLGHGSGQLLPGVDPDALKAYGSTIEETRADLYGLYYLADPKLVELGLTPNMEAYKSQYYHYMMNGMLTQLVRIKPGSTIEEAHMRNRALIAWWVYEQGKADKVVELVQRDGNYYVKVNDYDKLRALFGQLLGEIQRIKSEGDYAAARELVERYAVNIDADIHANILSRYARLNLAPYKGFINPVYTLVRDAKGKVTDVKVSYTEGYDAQMLRYSRDYSSLPPIN